MPYIEYLFCEHCGDYAKLDIDPAATIDAYSKDGRKQVAILQPTMVWDYLIYSCGICGKKYKYTYRDVERRVREYFSNLSQEFKEYFDAVIAQAEERGEDPSAPAKSVRIKIENVEPKAEKRVRELYTAKNNGL